MSGRPLSIAHVSPHPWGPFNQVNDYVAHLAERTATRGHRVLIAAPSDSPGQQRAARDLLDAAERDPDVLFADQPGGQVLALGASLPLPRTARAASVSVPIDVSRTLERLMDLDAFDIVHVHEPFAPSASNAALRHSRALNVASFHEAEERILSTQVARPLVEIFLGRLDARTVVSEATGAVLQRSFPGSYELVRGGAHPRPPREDRDDAPHLVFCLREEPGALRLFLRALRRLPTELPWRATVWTGADADPPVRLGRRLGERVRVVGVGDGPPLRFVREADVLCLATGGTEPAPGLVAEALAAGAVPVVPSIEIYRELTDDGAAALLYGVGDGPTLAAQLERVLADAELRRRLRAAAPPGVAERSWEDVSADMEAIYERVVSRRHEAEGDAVLRRRLAERPVIEVDLHMHTDHSPDCATPVRTLLETARDRGLGAIAITDHNEISGAMAAREIADEVGIKVIVGEEVKTAEQGEVIGLFLEELIPRGMTMRETIDAIRAQGGLVYVPHPFDRLHSVPDYEHLLGFVEDVDIIEVFNPRVAFSAFNEEAERFAAKYRIVAGAGSDAHVAQALGSVRTRLHDFDGPHEFLESMRDADIVRKHRNLVYVQALKWLQTSGPGRRVQAGREPGPVKGGRPRRRVAEPRGVASGRRRRD